MYRTYRVDLRKMRAYGRNVWRYVKNDPTAPRVLKKEGGGLP